MTIPSRRWRPGPRPLEGKGEIGYGSRIIRPWQYAFYLDVLGDPRGASGEAVQELRGLAEELRVLGSYVDGLRATA